MVPAEGQGFDGSPGARWPKALLLHRSKWQSKEGSASPAASPVCAASKVEKVDKKWKLPSGSEVNNKGQMVSGAVTHHCAPHTSDEVS